MPFAARLVGRGASTVAPTISSPVSQRATSISCVPEEVMSISDVSRVLGQAPKLAEAYQFVIVDCPPGLTDGTLASIAQSDKVAIIMTAELPSVRNAVRYLEHLSKLGYSSSTIQLVLNRHSKKGPLSDERVEKALGRGILFRIPNSYNEVIRAINAGAPISSATKSDFAAAIHNWAHDVATSKESAKKSEKMKALATAQSRGGVLGLFGR